MKLKLNPQARKALKSGERLNVGSSDGFWYDLTKGGYFDPQDVLSDPKQIAKVNEGIQLLQELEEIYDSVANEF